MRCCKDELAIVVKGAATGRVVYCVAGPMPDGWTSQPKRFASCNRGMGPQWVLDQTVPYVNAKNNEVVDIAQLPDSWLWPLRDVPGDDETLAIAGRPQYHQRKEKS